MTVSVQVTRGCVWILVDGLIIDVRHWARAHAGGAGVLLAAVGTDASAIFHGTNRVPGGARRALAHAHSRAAHGLLLDLAVGVIGTGAEEMAVVPTGGEASKQRAAEAAVPGAKESLWDSANDVIEPAGTPYVHQFYVTEKCSLTENVIKLVLEPPVGGPAALPVVLPGEYCELQVCVARSFSPRGTARDSVITCCMGYICVHGFAAGVCSDVGGVFVTRHDVPP